MSAIVLLSCLPILFTNLQDEKSRVFLKYIDECVLGCAVVWLIVERKNLQSLKVNMS